MFRGRRLEEVGAWGKVLEFPCTALVRPRERSVYSHELGSWRADATCEIVATNWRGRIAVVRVFAGVRPLKLVPSSHTWLVILKLDDFEFLIIFSVSGDCCFGSSELRDH